MDSFDLALITRATRIAVVFERLHVLTYASSIIYVLTLIDGTLPLYHYRLLGSVALSSSAQFTSSLPPARCQYQQSACGP